MAGGFVYNVIETPELSTSENPALLSVKKARLTAIFSAEGLEECFRQSRKLPARLGAAHSK